MYTIEKGRRSLPDITQTTKNMPVVISDDYVGIAPLEIEAASLLGMCINYYCDVELVQLN